MMTIEYNVYYLSLLCFVQTIHPLVLQGLKLLFSISETNADVQTKCKTLSLFEHIQDYLCRITPLQKSY